jgi:hypothetical protein
MRRRWSIPMGLLIAAVAAALAVTAISGVRPAQGSTPAASPVLSQSALTFHDAMRKLWEDHITWTRNVIISFEVNVPDASVTLPDLGAALDRLFTNQVDIGNAIKPYYGNQRGDQLTALLHDHIAIAGEILQAVKVGDAAAYQDANARWYANAHDIAVFLSGPFCKFVRGGHAACASCSWSSKRRSSRSRSDRVKCQSNGVAVCS